jgi:hypothetical protein
VVFASPHSQRFEHRETHCLRLLRLCFTSYVLNLSAENKKSKTTTLVGYSYLTYTPIPSHCQEVFLIGSPIFKS